MPVSNDALDREWSRPEGSFWTPKLASRYSVCLSIQDCSHTRCHWLRVVALHPCRCCAKHLGWGRHVKPDPQGSLFGPAWVHVDCIAGQQGFALLRSARAAVEPQAVAAMRRRK